MKLNKLMKCSSLLLTVAFYPINSMVNDKPILAALRNKSGIPLNMRVRKGESTSTARSLFTQIIPDGQLSPAFSLNDNVTRRIRAWGMRQDENKGTGLLLKREAIMANILNTTRAVPAYVDNEDLVAKKATDILVINVTLNNNNDAVYTYSSEEGEAELVLNQYVKQLKPCVKECFDRA